MEAANTGRERSTSKACAYKEKRRFSNALIRTQSHLHGRDHRTTLFPGPYTGTLLARGSEHEFRRAALNGTRYDGESEPLSTPLNREASLPHGLTPNRPLVKRQCPEGPQNPPAPRTRPR
jgi:hypothetical protein